MSDKEKNISLKKNLLAVLRQNKPLMKIINTISDLGTPDLFVGAGAIAQTVWNHFHGFELTKYISDIDIAYFDPSDLSLEAEAAVIEKIQQQFKHIPIRLDIKNQARVHLWYGDHFGYKIESYKSIYDAIDSWPTTSTAIGVRKLGNNYEVYAPFGLNDLFELTIRPNKRQITKEIYEKKCKRWKECWQELKIVEW